MKEFSITDQIYLCKYYDTVETYDLATGLGTTISLVERTIEVLKKNGLYEQYKKISDEDWEQLERQETRKRGRKPNIRKPTSEYPKQEPKIKPIVPGFHCAMASKLLSKYGFNKSFVGFEYWKHLIALMMCDNTYLTKSLNSEIYPYIAEKCHSTVVNVESQLRFSLKNSLAKGYTITSFLNKVLNNEEVEAKEPKIKEEIKEGEETKMEEKKTEESNDSQITINENTMIQVPAKILLDYYYMKRIHKWFRIKTSINYKLTVYIFIYKKCFIKYT